MLTLYKYMPMHVLLKFMNDPCLRITPSTCQNDPFEFGFTKSNIDALNSFAPQRMLGSSIKDFANRHGTISLSSAYDDVCMWSYYADSHSGAVVEILVDESNPFTSFLIPEFVVQRNYSDLLFGKVKYSSSRTLEALTNMNVGEIRNHYYFCKFERWSQEDEYRYVMPFDAVDKIVCTESILKQLGIMTGPNHRYFRKVIDNPALNLYEISNITIQTMTTEPSSYAILETLWNQSKRNNVMFFSRLDTGCPGITPGSVGNIYFGVNADLTEFMQSLEDEEGADCLYRKYVRLDDGNLHSLFQATIAENSYELKFSPITQRQFGPD